LRYAVAADVNPGIEAAATQPAGFVPQGGTQQLGAYLFNKQLVNLELAGLILTVAMVGAIVIARKRVVVPGGAFPPPPRAPETVVGPATPVDDNPHSIPVYGTDNPRQKEYPET
jgi:NADH-quinone oxidoreductase subunit J